MASSSSSPPPPPPYPSAARISDSLCFSQYTASLKCLESNQDKTKCQQQFDDYKECKKKEVLSRLSFIGTLAHTTRLSAQFEKTRKEVDSQMRRIEECSTHVHSGRGSLWVAKTFSIDDSYYDQ